MLVGRVERVNSRKDLFSRLKCERNEVGRVSLGIHSVCCRSGDTFLQHRRHAHFGRKYHNNIDVTFISAGSRSAPNYLVSVFPCAQ
jgi:hypothetical protein